MRFGKQPEQRAQNGKNVRKHKRISFNGSEQLYQAADEDNSKTEYNGVPPGAFVRLRKASAGYIATGMARAAYPGRFFCLIFVHNRNHRQAARRRTA